MHLQFVKYRRIFYAFSLMLTILSIASILVFGLKLSIDLTGGSLFEFSFKGDSPSVETIKEKLIPFNLGEIALQKAGDKGFILKTKNIDEKIHQEILTELKTIGDIDEGSQSFQSIGPAIGAEMKKKTEIVVVLSLLVILIYIAISFRKISRPIKSWMYGLTSIIALLHDVLIPVGIFAVLGRFLGAEISIPIITAFLTVFGYSINDSVVVFDRLRENLLKSRVADFDLLVDASLNQTMARSFYTSFTTLLALFAVFFLGGETLRYFSLALILGIGFGTYSSIFIASLLLVSYYKLKEKKN